MAKTGLLQHRNTSALVQNDDMTTHHNHGEQQATNNYLVIRNLIKLPGASLSASGAFYIHTHTRTHVLIHDTQCTHVGRLLYLVSGKRSVINFYHLLHYFNAHLLAEQEFIEQFDTFFRQQVETRTLNTINRGWISTDIMLHVQLISSQLTH